ncbi:MAG: hypothetical protein E7540_00615 [Ruminococcaceae bacterium]|nr:hypothetical protein [Oscillospiraceae bacterium]
MKKVLKITEKILLCFVAVLLALVILVLGGLNIAKYAIYSDFYSYRDVVCKNPGLNDGFVHQGICVDDESGKIVLSGYMADHTASRLYVTDVDNNSYYVSLNKENKAFDGHCGGVAISGDTVYIATDDAMHLIPRVELLNAKNGDTLNIKETIPTNNQASYIYVDNNYLYVGEFHDGNKYITDHPYETPDGLYHAIISRYNLNDLTKPDRVYSVRNKVQGILFAEGKIVLSTSYGIADSVYYVYNEADCIKSEHTLDGAPVYYVNNPENEFTGPAMAEGLDLYNGKAITMSESASNKYIFGKFFFANKIVTLDILK